MPFSCSHSTLLKPVGGGHHFFLSGCHLTPQPEGAIFVLSLCLAKTSGSHLCFFFFFSLANAISTLSLCDTQWCQYLPEGRFEKFWCPSLFIYFLNVLCPSFCSCSLGDTSCVFGFGGQRDFCSWVPQNCNKRRHNS